MMHFVIFKAGKGTSKGLSRVDVWPGKLMINNCLSVSFVCNVESTLYPPVLDNIKLVQKI